MFSTRCRQKKTKREKRNAAEKHGRAGTYGAFKTTVCTRTHADNLALGNTDPPEQKAYTTTFRPREVVAPPMEVVPRPTCDAPGSNFKLY